MSIIDRIKADIDLRDYLEAKEDHVFKGSKTLCPFHDDNNPSMDVNFENGVWLWHCHSCGAGGDIISYLKKKRGIGVSEVIKTLKPLVSNDYPSSQHIEYIYRDIDGKGVFKKEKVINSNGKKKYIFYHRANGSWHKGKGNLSPLPYNLDKFANYEYLIVCEGEKDADTINV